MHGIPRFIKNQAFFVDSSAGMGCCVNVHFFCHGLLLLLQLLPVVVSSIFQVLLSWFSFLDLSIQLAERGIPVSHPLGGSMKEKKKRKKIKEKKGFGKIDRSVAKSTFDVKENLITFLDYLTA